MRYSLMQPYFFPYLGYFSLIARADKWVVFDTAQYIKGGWINRNRVLHPEGGWRYITVPVAAHPHNTPIHAVDFRADPKSIRRLRNKVLAWPKAPGAARVKALVDEVLASATPSMAELSLRSLRAVCQQLELDFEPVRLSQTDWSLPQNAEPGDWGWIVGQQLGASTYVNPPGGRALFDPQTYARHGMRIEIIQNRLQPYSQARGEHWEPGLSILDALLWCSPETVRSLIEDYTIEQLPVGP